MASEELQAECLVVGTGPGGSITAALLAEAGREVLMLEEGPFLPLESCPPFSRTEMVQKYRNGGLTVAMGRSKIAYVEGRCVGGGSEVNSGLYHRTPPEILEEWRTSHQVEELTEEDLRPHCEANERELSVSRMPGGISAASWKLHEGATQLGWRSLEVPRWYAYDPSPADGPASGTKQTMTKTFVPRALAAGAKLIPDARAVRLRKRAGVWQVSAEQGQAGAAPRRLQIRARDVFVACGATQTPALLQRSGLGRHVGHSLHLHPTVKVVARFPEDVNSQGMGVPVHQVKEFSPRLSLGGSISSLPYLLLALIDHPLDVHDIMRDWSKLAVYYGMTRGGSGSVRTLPFFRAPLVRYRLGPSELADLADAIDKLCRCLLAAGATTLYPSFAGAPTIRCEADLAKLPATLPADRANLMTIHLFSSCPMGEDRRKCVANSFGEVHGESNLWIADGSLLPGPPGVNPQGTIMAIARRNVERFLKRL